MRDKFKYYCFIACKIKCVLERIISYAIRLFFPRYLIINFTLSAFSCLFGSILKEIKSPAQYFFSELALPSMNCI